MVQIAIVFMFDKNLPRTILWDMPDIGGFYAFALAYDLGKLKHLEEYGVDLQKNMSIQVSSVLKILRVCSDVKIV